MEREKVRGKERGSERKKAVFGIIRLIDSNDFPMCLDKKCSHKKKEKKMVEHNFT